MASLDHWSAALLECALLQEEAEQLESLQSDSLVVGCQQLEDGPLEANWSDESEWSVALDQREHSPDTELGVEGRNHAGRMLVHERDHEFEYVDDVFVLLKRHIKVQMTTGSDHGLTTRCDRPANLPRAPCASS